jgi:hypothetical protein
MATKGGLAFAGRRTGVDGVRYGGMVFVKTEVKLVLVFIPAETAEQSVVHIYRRVNWRCISRSGRWHIELLSAAPRVWTKHLVWARGDVLPQPQKRFVCRVEDDAVTGTGK